MRLKNWSFDSLRLGR